MSPERISTLFSVSLATASLVYKILTLSPGKIEVLARKRQQESEE